MKRCLILMTWLIFSAAARGTEFDLYYLGGQSNMDGYGFVNELPDNQQGAVEDVYIFHGNQAPDGVPVDGRGLWTPLRPGHGVGFQSDGSSNTYSHRFGVELSFARRIREAHPERPVAIIKYSRGGTSIAIEAARHFGCWDPDFTGGSGEGLGVNQYDHCLACLRSAANATDIDGDGETDRLIPRGIVWMQGESDAALDAATAEAYQSNLKRLMDLLRAALRTDDLPVVIGRISDSGQDADGKVWDYGDTVRDAQQSFVKRDGHAALVTTTDQYGYSDKWHYDSAGYLDLGREFADGLLAAPPADGR